MWLPPCAGTEHAMSSVSSDDPFPDPLPQRAAEVFVVVAESHAAEDYRAGVILNFGGDRQGHEFY